LQAAIDFAGAADAELEAWPALHLSLILSGLLGTSPAYHPAAHRANFWAMQFAKVQLILRCCGSGREVAKLECVE